VLVATRFVRFLTNVRFIVKYKQKMTINTLL
jgi:hypothetical protein